MTSLDVVYEKIHFRHDPKWTCRWGPPDRGGVILCVACVIEMMESCEISSVRKSVALSGVSGVLRFNPGALRALLRQDHRVCLHFTASLLGMLHTDKNAATLERVVQVLVQLLLELQSEEYVRFVLTEIHTQLCEQASVREFFPTFTFLGKLLDAAPNLSHSLTQEHGPLLERLCSALLHPDEGLKTSLFYVWQRVCGAAAASGGAPFGAQSLPGPLRERLCTLLLQTLAQACCPQLTINCLGLLLQLLKMGEVVSFLMNSSAALAQTQAQTQTQTQNQNQTQTQTQASDSSSPQLSLPLILKKLLLSGDEMLQVASAQCMVAILVHSPAQYCSPFIMADVPEFLFECLCTSSEALLWSAHSCLLMLTEDPLFFSQCHSVYGIESLVCSLKQAMKMNSLEVQKQGLLLLSEVLDRQPVGLHLFSSGSSFQSVAEVVQGGVASSSLQVATQATHTATLLLRLQHQSSPVQYEAVERLVEAVTTRCAELPLPSSSFLHRPGPGSLQVSEAHCQASSVGGFLLQALVCLQAACRLAEQCASEPVLKENVFTAPSSQSQDSLQSLCVCLLHSCDSVCIPTVTRQRSSSPQVLQSFYSVLLHQFSLLPALMPRFAAKLASSGFYRLALEHKAVHCVGGRNSSLNVSCSVFIQKLSVCLLSQISLLQDQEEVDSVLGCVLPALCVRLSDWPSLLAEVPGGHMQSAGPRDTQHCLLLLLQLALQHGDRLLPDSTVFSSVCDLLCSVQHQGHGPPLAPWGLRAALYLLAVTQDQSPPLDWAPLNSISQILSSFPSFSSLYIHHAPLLHFLYRYPELAQDYGARALELWLSHPSQEPHRRARVEVTDPDQDQDQGQNQGQDQYQGQDQNQDQGQESAVLLALMEKNPSVVLTMLGLVCSREGPLAERALALLGAFLQGRGSWDAGLGALLTPTLLQVVQRLTLEGPGQGVLSLSLVLRLLCVTQISRGPADSNTDGTHFKLLYHVSTLTGRLNPSNTECLLPAFTFLHCCLSLGAAHCGDGAVSMLLNNAGLMNQLQAILSSSSSSSFSSSSSSSSSLSSSCALLCHAHLLLCSLITLQHTHCSQVHKRISLDLDRLVQTLLSRKRHTHTLLLASSLKLLQAVLDVDVSSELLCVAQSGSRPQGGPDSCLHPLGSSGALRLATALYSLLLQKQHQVLRMSVSCLGSLLAYLQRKSPVTAQHVVCQPWCRLLLHCLLQSGESSLLHPATLSLLSLLVAAGSSVVKWEPDLRMVLEAVETRGLEELEEPSAQALTLLLRQTHTHTHTHTQALTLLLRQVQSSVLHSSPCEEQRRCVDSLMESLPPLPPTHLHLLTTNILQTEELSTSLSVYTVKMNTAAERAWTDVQ